VDILIKALGLLNTKNIRVLLIGLNEQSDYTAKMHLLAKDLNVEHMITWVGISDDVAFWLRQSDVYVQSSRTEALSLAAVEAASLGLPVIGSEVGGLPEIASKTFPVEDYNSLASIILELYDDRTKCVEIGKQARKKFLKDFTLQKAVNNYNRIYHL